MRDAALSWRPHSMSSVATATAPSDQQGALVMDGETEDVVDARAQNALSSG